VIYLLFLYEILYFVLVYHICYSTICLFFLYSWFFDWDYGWRGGVRFWSPIVCVYEHTLVPLWFWVIGPHPADPHVFLFFFLSLLKRGRSTHVVVSLLSELICSEMTLLTTYRYLCCTKIYKLLHLHQDVERRSGLLRLPIQVCIAHRGELVRQNKQAWKQTNHLWGQGIQHW